MFVSRDNFNPKNIVVNKSSNQKYEIFYRYNNNNYPLMIKINNVKSYLCNQTNGANRTTTISATIENNDTDFLNHIYSKYEEKSNTYLSSKY